LLAIDEDARKIAAEIFKEVKIIVRRQEPQQET
jgi:hypothetical protein